MNLNKIILIGRVTKDPELKSLPTGTAVVKLGMATNHVFKAKDGTKKETAQFHNCVAFGRTAETIGQWVKKGQEILVEGRVEYRSWDKKDGTKGYITEILVESFQFGQKAKGAEQVGREQVGSEQMPTIEIPPEEEAALEKAGAPIREEDLPF